MGIEKQLASETKKWADKIKKELPLISATKGNEDFLRNINAYVSDSGHFLKKNIMEARALSVV